jgi:hypothetical protein
MVEVPVKVNVLEQAVPFWTGFNKILSDRQPYHVVVAYPPIIDAKPADMATVYTTCKKRHGYQQIPARTFRPH